MPVYFDKKRQTWFISASYTVRKGVYKKKTVRGFKSKRIAQRHEHLLMAKLQSEVQKANQCALKLNDMWKEYFDYQSLNKWKGQTSRHRQSIYTNHIQPYFGERNILHISKKEIGDWHTMLTMKKKLTRSSINIIISVFSGIYTYANTIYDINYHPISNVGYLKVTKEEKRKEVVILEQKDFTTFLNAVEGIEMKLIFLTLYYTGLRIQELQNLKWKDLKKNSLIITKAKTNNSYRIVPISNNLETALKKYKAICQKEDIFIGNGGYMFCGRTFQQPISRYRIESALQVALDKCNLKRMTPHDFRHTYVTLLLQEGYDDHAIAELIGDTPETVRMVYAHFLPTRRKSITEFFDKYVPDIPISI